MLPTYELPQLTMASLTDNIMTTALERRDLPVSIETARSACYCWMSHPLVWDNILGKFQEELAAGGLECTGQPPLDVVIALSDEVYKILCDTEIRIYRDTKLNKDQALNAMRASRAVDEDAILTLLAALAVEGKTGMKRNYDDMLMLEETGLSMDDLLAIADAY